MLGNMLLGLITMVICLMLQVTWFVMMIRYYARHQHQLNDNSYRSSFVLVSTVMMILVAGIFAQIAIWAGLFQILGEFDTFSVAFYHSTVNFASLGYGDIVMSEQRRLLGAIEAINGMLMIGISIAALMVPFKDALQRKGIDKV